MIIVDLSILLYSNYFIIKKDMQAGRLTGYDLAKMVNISVNKLKREMTSHGVDVVLCLDGGSWRKDYCRTYKQSRKPDELLNEAKKVVYDTLQFHKMVHHIGMEADDWGFLLSRKYDRGLLVTNDEDWIQFIRPGMPLMNFRSKQVITHKDVDVLWEQFLKISKGCPSDEIPPAVMKGTYTTKIRNAYNHWKVLRSANDPDYELHDQMFDAFVDVGVDVNMDQLKENVVVASYSIDLLKKVFSKDWDSILSKC